MLVLLILEPSDYFLFPNMNKKYLAGKQYQIDDEVICELVEDFSEDPDERCTMDPSAVTPPGRSVWTAAGETMLKNKQKVKFDHSIIVSICVRPMGLQPAQPPP